MEIDPVAESPTARWTKYRALATLVEIASQRARNFAFLDQVLVSGANFVGGILLARAFGMYEFGRFTLAWMFVEFIGSLQFAAIIQPMLNIGAKQAEADTEEYYQAVIAQQVAASIVFSLSAWLVITLVGWLVSDPEFSRLATPLCAAVMAFQLHSFFRRYFFARERVVAAVCTDVLRFVAQISATVALPFAWPGATAAAGIWIIAAACALSAIQGAFYFGQLGWNTAAFRKVTARHWEFSKWLLPSALMYWMSSQGFWVMSGFVLGAATTGGLKAAYSITGVLHILLLALDNFAPVQAARALHLGGHADLRRYIARLAVLTGALTMAALALLNIAPGYVVHLIYGHQYEGIENLVRWLCAPAVVYAISTVLVIWVAAMEWTRLIFVSYAVATVFTVVAAYPLTLYGGWIGAVSGTLLVEIIRVLVLLVPLLRFVQSDRKANSGAFAQRVAGGEGVPTL